MSAEEARPSRARARNRLSILEAARDQLTGDPDASMEDVAVAAGMVRRTVYGHFPTRAELVAALVHAAAHELMTEAGEIDPQVREPDVELAVLALRTWGVARRFGAVIELARRDAPDEVRAGMAPFHARVADLITQGQHRGVFATDLDPTLMARVMHGTALTCLSAQRAGQWHGDAADVAYLQLLALGVPADTARTTTHRARIDRGALDEI